jgi:hypothetical protein
MNEQIKSLIEPVKGGNLANLSSSEHLSLRETMSQAEAREWIQRYKKKMLEHGRSEAFAWWQSTLADISKKRGAKAAEDLRQRMNAQKEQND